MATILRLDAIELHATEQLGAFEDFVRNELVPTFRAAYGGPPTRKSIAGLEGLALLTNGSAGGGYILVSTWGGRLDDVADKDFNRATMETHDDARAALRKLDGFGRRGKPQVYELVVGSLTVS